MASRQKSLNIIIRPSDRCNQNCLYCYVDSNTRRGAGPKLSLERLESFFGRILTGDIYRRVNIVWHGGEPTLLGIEYLNSAIQYVKRIKNDRVSVEHAIQTNATALTDGMIDLLFREKVIVGISLDAPPEIHDRYRTFWSGAPTMKKVLTGIDKLRDAGIKFGAICVLHSQNYFLAREIYNFFKQLRLNYQLNPFYRAEAVTSGAVLSLGITPAQYAEALLETFEAYANDQSHTIDVKEIRDILTSMMIGSSTNCLYRGACDEFLGISAQGLAYSCDNFGVSEALIGNIDSLGGLDIIKSKAVQFIKHRPRVLQSGHCRGCNWWGICRGGCSSKAHAVFGNLHREDPFCGSRKVLFDRIASFIQTLQSSKENENEGKAVSQDAEVASQCD